MFGQKIFKEDVRMDRVIDKLMKFLYKSQEDMSEEKYENVK